MYSLNQIRALNNKGEKMGIVKASEVKRIVKENKKQLSKEFVVAFDDRVKRLLVAICKKATNKRLKVEDIQI